MDIPPIAYAVISGNFDLVKERTAKGADINLISDKGTAVYVACLYKRYDILTFLLENGADPNLKPKHGKEPIEIAEDIATVDLLRKFGVTKFGIYDYRNLKALSEPNQLILGNKNSESFLLQDDSSDLYHISINNLCLEHIVAIEECLDISQKNRYKKPDFQDSTYFFSVYKLHEKFLKLLQLNEEDAFELSKRVVKKRVFSKMNEWDKYQVFIALNQIASIYFVSKKRKLALFFKEWTPQENASY